MFFHANHESKDNKTAHIQKLNECIIHVSTDPKTLIIILDASCYESKLKELSNETTLVLSNIRELDRVSSTK